MTGAGVGTGTPLFIHRATAGSITGDSSHITTIDHPLCNDDPHAILLVTHNWTEDSAAPRYESHPVGVFYDAGHWAIFHEDLAAMPAGRAFNVMVVKP